MQVLDGHTHAFPDAIAAGAIKTLTAEAKWFPVSARHEGTVGGLVVSMDRAGIRRAIMCSVATKPTQVEKITAWSAAIASDRIIPFASIHPDYDNVEAEVERIVGLGIKGLKFHSQYMNCAVDDPRVLRIARAAAQAGLAMAFHAGHDLAFDRSDIASPRRMLRLHESVPKLRLQACHLGGWHQWEEVLELLAGRDIYLETSFVFGHCDPEMVEKIMAKHSPDYLMFGTDSPWADQKEELARFRALKLGAVVERKAMWENGRRFIGVTLQQ